jgi:hypothetical protein
MTIFIICAVLITIAVIVAVVFLIQTLIQIKKTAFEAEMLMRNVNREVALVEKITETISGFVANFSSPWVKIGSVLTSVVSSWWGKHKKGQKNEEQEQPREA